MRATVAAFVLALLVGCGREEAPAPEPDPRPSTAAAATRVVAQLRVVDLEGRPLANMAPIATLQPNAFDKPVVQGALTKEDGQASLVLPNDQLLYVRAWDPNVRMFANNYLEIRPGPATSTQQMDVVMVPGASLDAVLAGRDGKPAANVRVGLMMVHPAEGPWWPDRADTNARGAVHFPSVPAGKYTIRIKLAAGGESEIADIYLPPGGAIDLGTVTLQ